MPEFIGERHQRHRAQTRLHIFFGLVFRQSGKHFLKLTFENGERFGDRDVQQFDPEISRELLRVVDAAARRILARHRNADHVLRADGFDGNRSDHPGINSAAETEHSRFEITFSQIIAQTQRKRGEELLRCRFFAELENSGRFRIDDLLVFAESR